LNPLNFEERMIIYKFSVNLFYFITFINQFTKYHLRGDIMGLFDWVDEKIPTLKWCDISMIKLSSAAFALMIAKLWTPLLALEWHWYLIIAILASIKPMIKMFK
tara:strand:- start:542 stop:853 length:312 start_codon:yes stop_codon:yes gene_type:complete